MFTFENLKLGDRVVYDATIFVPNHRFTGKVYGKFIGEDGVKQVAVWVDAPLRTANNEYYLQVMVCCFDFIFAEDEYEDEDNE